MNGSGFRPNKDGIINEMKEYDEQFMLFLFRSLSSSEKLAVIASRDRIVQNVELRELYSLDGHDDCPILNTAYSEFQDGRAITMLTMDAILQMFRSREADIALNYVYAFANRQNFHRRKQNYFISGRILDYISKETQGSFNSLHKWIGQGEFNQVDVDRIFVLLPYASKSSSRWILGIADLLLKSFIVIDFMAQSNIEKKIVLQSVKKISDSLKAMFAVDWEVKWHPYASIPVCVDPSDTGICAIGALYFAVHQCPIYFETSHIQAFREKFLHFLINKHLPM
jgi:hypothetical protein